MRRIAIVSTVPALLALAAIFSSGHAGSGFAALPFATTPTVSAPTATVPPSLTPTAPATATPTGPPTPAPTATPPVPYELPFAATDIVFDPARPYLYASDKAAPPHWQEKNQLKKGLRGKVRRLVKDLGLDGWKKQVPTAVEHYAVIHYSKP